MKNARRVVVKIRRRRRKATRVVPILMRRNIRAITETLVDAPESPTQEYPNTSNSLVLTSLEC